jgi:endothelin-converting enzyme/putative endopeptidase
MIPPMSASTLLALALLASSRPPDRPLAALPYTPGLDPKAMDRSANPCVDFYAYSCGGWLRQNPIPADQASWSVYAKTATENRQFLWGLLEQVAAKPDAARTAEERKVGGYFTACMDEKAVEKAGARPLQADLSAIDRLSRKEELARLVGRLHLSVDSGMLFGFGSAQSFDDAEQVVAWVTAGGLGLPDRDQYLAEGATDAALRKDYQAHVERMLRLTGLAAGAAADGARTVLRIETALARASLTRVEKRDPRKLWHRTASAELARATPSFRWGEYLEEAGAPPGVEWVNVAEPAFLAELERLLAAEPLPAWKTYLRWHLVRSRASSLSRRFQEASFDFYGRRLEGVRELKPRWKRCVAWVDRDLGEALGRIFSERVFPPAMKADAERMVGLVQAAMRARIDRLAWMSAETRRAAHEKLAAMRNKIGFPDRWRDYSALEVRPDDFAGNVQRSLAFETRRQLAKIGKPVDRDEWQMTPPTVNAYYDPSLNEMNFPAGVLLPPLWDTRLDLAPGYGNTGQTVGHELVHGFDDEGRRFDARGNLRDWWSAADAAEFEKRARCIEEQYAAYPVIDDLKINSQLTLGEDLADLGGVLLAWDAWKAATASQPLEARDGLTPEQRFFVGAAQWACANERPEDLRVRALTDPHSPPRWRVNGLLANVPEFARAFACRPGQPMVREPACTVW